MDRELYGTSDDGVLEETDVGDFSEHRLGSFRVPAPHAPVGPVASRAVGRSRG